MLRESLQQAYAERFVVKREYVWALKFDPTQPRDKKGQWVTLYHGTRGKDVESIQREGLKPGAAKLIWATESKEEAQRFAEGLDYPEKTVDPTVIEIRAPKSAFFFEKSMTPGKKIPVGQRTARFTQPIPPEQILTPEMCKGGEKGLCFANANRWNARYGAETDRVVHGKVTNAEGKTFDHAWIERANGTVVDPTTGVALSKEKYYALLKAKPEASYDSTTAIRNQIRARHHGPWTPQDLGLKFDEAKHPRDKEGQFAYTRQGARGALQDAVGEEIPVGVDDHPTAIDGAHRVAAVLREMRAKGYEMPTEIEVRANAKKHPSGAAEDRGLLEISVPDHLPDGMTLDEAFNIAYGSQNKIAVVENGELRGEIRKFVGDTFRDLVIHEMGHINRRKPPSMMYITVRSTPEEHAQAAQNSLDFTVEMASIKRFERQARLHVSEYAATNPDEFVAEVFTLLYNGRTLPPETMYIYDALRGARIR
jgi:hypothetical protein